MAAAGHQKKQWRKQPKVCNPGQSAWERLQEIMREQDPNYEEPEHLRNISSWEDDDKVLEDMARCPPGDRIPDAILVEHQVLVNPSSLMEAASLSNNCLFVAASDSVLREWDITPGKRPELLHGTHQLWVHHMAVNDDLLYVAVSEKTLHVFDCRDSPLMHVHSIYDHVGHATVFLFVRLQGRKMLVSGVSDGLLHFYDLTFGPKQMVLLASASTGREGGLKDAVWIGENLIVLVGWDQTIRVFVVQPEEVVERTPPDQKVRRHRRVTGNSLHEVYWNMEHDESVVALALAPPSSGRRLLASSSYDRTVRLWDVTELEDAVKRGHAAQGFVCVGIFDKMIQSVSNMVFFSPSHLVTSGWDHTLRVLDLTDVLNHPPNLVATVAGAREHVEKILLHGTRLFTICMDNRVRVFELKEYLGTGLVKSKRPVSSK